MPATPGRIAFITEEFRKVVATTAAAQTRFGSLARESDDPIETCFETQSDAQAVCNARQTLLGSERRRFQTKVVGLSEVLALNYIGAVPKGRYVDTERDADRAVLLSDLVIDLETQTATLTVWG